MGPLIAGVNGTLSTLDAPELTAIARISGIMQSAPDGLLDGRVRPIRAVEKKRRSRHKRWLGEKARAGTTMLLSCMHKKRMAQVDGAWIACCQYLAPRSRFRKTRRSD